MELALDAKNEPEARRKNAGALTDEARNEGVRTH
jgi:hypothetical protein